MRPKCVAVSPANLGKQKRQECGGIISLVRRDGGVYLGGPSGQYERVEPGLIFYCPAFFFLLLSPRGIYGRSVLLPSLLLGAYLRPRDRASFEGGGGGFATRPPRTTLPPSVVLSLLTLATGPETIGHRLKVISRNSGLGLRGGAAAPFLANLFKIRAKKFPRQKFS